ncbi:MAG: TIGR02147 family protein [Chitinivibrionales bacterium]|nr:TIGR02147 family protein [Chitinivibrionales bacterium]
MSSVLDYTDYRKFLADYLQAAKKTRPELSHRYIQRHMGVSSSGFLSNVIKGKKNLTPAMATRLVRVLKLPKEESRYFECLVLFNQAKSHDERHEYLTRLRSRMPRALTPKQMTLFSKWYYVVVREMLSYVNFSDDYESLASEIAPPITVQQAKEAVRTLTDIGLVRRGSGGLYVQADNAIATDDEVRSADLASFQLHTMDMAKNALRKTPGEQRDISTLTVSMSEKNFERFKGEIQRFRKHLASLACNDQAPDGVYQINIQLFPMTRGQNGNP